MGSNGALPIPVATPPPYHRPVTVTVALVVAGVVLELVGIAFVGLADVEPWIR